MHNPERLVLGSVLLLLPMSGVLADDTTYASRSTELRYATAIDLSSRQTLTVHRSLCAAYQSWLGIGAERCGEELQTELARFEEIHATLKRGGPELGLPMPSSPVAAAHARIEPLWQTFRSVLEEVRARSAESPQRLDRAGRALAEACDRLGSAYEAEAREAMGWGAARQVHCAGNLRGVPHEVLQRLYAATMGIDPESQRRAIAARARSFEHVREMLRVGDAPLAPPAPPGPAMQAQLDVLQRMWGDFHALVSDSAAGRSPDEEALLRGRELADSLLTGSEALAREVMTRGTRD